MTDRVTTEALAQLLVVANVDDLHPWDGNPWTLDTDAASTRDATFGKLRTPVVLAGEVVYGAEVVEAERLHRNDGGQVRVIDLTPTGWPPERAHAWAIGQMTSDRAALVDDSALGEALLALAAYDDLLEAAGWSQASLASFADGPSPAAAAAAAAAVGNVSDYTRTPNELRDAYEASSVRSVVLTYPAATYDRIAEQLSALRRHRDAYNNAELVAALVEDAYKR